MAIGNVFNGLTSFVKRQMSRFRPRHFRQIVYQSRIHEGDKYCQWSLDCVKRYRDQTSPTEMARWQISLDMMDEERRQLVDFSECKHSLRSQLAFLAKSDRYRSRAKELYNTVHERYGPLIAATFRERLVSSSSEYLSATPVITGIVITMSAETEFFTDPLSYIDVPRSQGHSRHISNGSTSTLLSDSEYSRDLDTSSEELDEAYNNGSRLTNSHNKNVRDDTDTALSARRQGTINSGGPNCDEPIRDRTTTTNSRPSGDGTIPQINAQCGQYSSSQHSRAQPAIDDMIRRDASISPLEVLYSTQPSMDIRLPSSLRSHLTSGTAFEEHSCHLATNSASGSRYRSAIDHQQKMTYFRSIGSVGRAPTSLPIDDSDSSLGHILPDEQRAIALASCDWDLVVNETETKKNRPSESGNSLKCTISANRLEAQKRKDSYRVWSEDYMGKTTTLGQLPNPSKKANVD